MYTWFSEVSACSEKEGSAQGTPRSFQAVYAELQAGLHLHGPSSPFSLCPVVLGAAGVAMSIGSLPRFTNFISRLINFSHPVSDRSGHPGRLFCVYLQTHHRQSVPSAFRSEVLNIFRSNEIKDEIKFACP